MKPSTKSRGLVRNLKSSVFVCETFFLQCKRVTNSPSYPNCLGIIVADQTQTPT